MRVEVSQVKRSHFGQTKNNAENYYCDIFVVLKTELNKFFMVSYRFT